MLRTELCSTDPRVERILERVAALFDLEGETRASGFPLGGHDRFRDLLAGALRAEGFDARTEFPQPYQGRSGKMRAGRLDLWVLPERASTTRRQPVAIELDSALRAKSVTKLLLAAPAHAVLIYVGPGDPFDFVRVRGAHGRISVLHVEAPARERGRNGSRRRP